MSTLPYIIALFLQFWNL